MIRKLQIKFVAMCMALVTVVLAATFLSAFLTAQKNIEAISHQVLARVIQESSSNGASGSVVIPNLGGDRVVQLPYFTVALWDRGGSYDVYFTGGTYANLENTDTLSEILNTCLTQEESEGTINAYNLRYLRQYNGLFLKVAFVDTSMEQAMLRETMTSYLQIGLAALLLLLGVSILLSCWATRPVARAWQQQRQFLSDASHELKTPLTVILSNAELLKSTPLEQRPSRWADNILSEAAQMKKLVEKMLTLARADNMAHTAVMAEASLSEVAMDCALAFEPVAFEAGKPLEYTIAPDVTVVGDLDKLRQAVSALLDNAIKYGRTGGSITMTLQRTDRQARLTVSNPGDPIPPEQLKRLFERFYRADASRGEQSGFGLGLPIAAAIASEHRGTLKAESDTVSTRFILTLPLKK